MTLRRNDHVRLRTGAKARVMDIDFKEYRVELTTAETARIRDDQCFWTHLKNVECITFRPIKEWVDE